MSAPMPQNAAGKLAKTVYVVTAEPTTKAPQRHAVLQEHLAYLAELEQSGHLFLAGPVVGEAGASNGGGLFVLRAASLAEATEIAARDPYNRDGYRVATVRGWRIDQGAFSLNVSLSRGSHGFS